MEQAINQFTKGLLMDTNPMMQENTTLSDALNATITTLNGNELILQNDMGNRRVDHAYLPSGYEPVGIKEYGGVIYIACYNPITNKGQVGSFPSPERRMEIPDIGPTATKLDTLFDVDEKHDLKSDTVLLPLTSGQVLHAGDKFVIYDNDITDYKDEISNYENIQPVGSGKDSLVLSPKNRTYTLSVGVLNSQNEFMDITKSLCRWQDDGTGKFEIIKYNKQSELYKFNDGYFIPGNYTPEGLTGDDANLVKARQTIEANTYSYKLVGPLYLKVHLNHFQDFNYNMYADKDGDNYINLYIESTIVYNCPDYAKTYKSEGSYKYRTLELIREPLNGKWFDFTLTPIPKNALDDWTEKDINPNIDINTFKLADKLYIGNSTIPQSAPGQSTIDTNPYDVNPGREQEVDIDDEVDTDIEYNYESSYDEDNDLYTLKFVQKYKHFLSSNVKKLHYTIRPYVLWKNHTTNNDNKGYLKDLMAEGNIDTSKLGTNVVDITEWRFFNYTDSTRLIYSFEAYPKFGTKFETLDLEFYKCSETGVSEEAEFTIRGLEFRNGRSTVNFNWGEYNIKPRELYLVKIKVAGADDIVERWFLSTELMNDCFNTVNDFGDKTNTTVQDKLTVKLDSSNSIVDNSTIIYSSKTKPLNENSIGEWISKQSGDIKLCYEHTYNLNLSILPGIKMKDEELYPPYFNVSGTSQINNFQLDQDLINTTNSNINTNATKVNIAEDQTYIDVINDQITQLNKTISGEIKFKDIFIGYSTQEGQIANPFGKVKDFLKYAIFPDPERRYLYRFGGIVQDYDTDKNHYFGIIGPNSSEKIYYDGAFKDNSHKENYSYDEHGDVIKVSKQVGDEISIVNEREITNIEDLDSENHGKYDRTFSAVKGEVYTKFNEKFPSSTFIYYFEDLYDIYNHEDRVGNEYALGTMQKSTFRDSNNNFEHEELLFDTNARVWWRTLQGNWALLESPFKKQSDNFYSFVLKHLFGNNYSNIIYSYKSSEALVNLNLYKPGNVTYQFNELYTLSPRINITLKYENIQSSFDPLNLFSINQTYLSDNIFELKSFQSLASFQDECMNMVSSMPSGVAVIKDGDTIQCLTLDSNSLDLDINSFYNYNNGQLEILNLPYKRSTIVGYDNYYTILYDESSGSNPLPAYRYDCVGRNKSGYWTILDYSGAIIVKDRR